MGGRGSESAKGSISSDDFNNVSWQFKFRGSSYSVNYDQNEVSPQFKYDNELHSINNQVTTKYNQLEQAKRELKAFEKDPYSYASVNSQKTEAKQKNAIKRITLQGQERIRQAEASYSEVLKEQSILQSKKMQNYVKQQEKAFNAFRNSSEWKKQVEDAAKSGAGTGTWRSMHGRRY